MATIKFNYSGVEAVRNNLSNILTEIETTCTKISTDRSNMTNDWAAKEAEQFYVHVDNLIDVLGRFKQKYSAFIDFLDQAVNTYRSEDEIILAAIDSMSDE